MSDDRQSYTASLPIASYMGHTTEDIFTSGIVQNHPVDDQQNLDNCFIYNIQIFY